MRFLVDECTGPFVSQWLREQNHNVFSVYEEARGLDDDTILAKANEGNWILITNDKDFGEKIYRGQHPHRGIILLRLENESATNKIEVINHLIENYRDMLTDNFVVATEKRVRFVTTG